MRLATCWFVAATGLALATAAQAGGQPAAPPAPVVLYADVPEDTPPDVLTAVQDEISSIMAPLGLRFAWRDLNAASGNETYPDLAVVKFKGRCDAGELPPSAGSSSPLGWTHISDGVILPFTDIDCDSMRSFLSRQLTGFQPPRRNPTFGRALGRVLAHELYHIFANTRHHGTDGIGKPSYTVRDLVSDVFRFEKHDAAAIRVTTAPRPAEVNSELEPRTH